MKRRERRPDELAEGVDVDVAVAWIAARNLQLAVERGYASTRRFKVVSREDPTRVVGEIDRLVLNAGIARRRGVELSVTPGKPVRFRVCWCGRFFLTQQARESLCEKCRSLRSQTVCAGFGGLPCPNSARAKGGDFKTVNLRRRNGEAWRCLKCAGRKAHAVRTPDQRSAMMRRVRSAVTPEQSSEFLRKARAAIKPEQHSKAAREMHASRTPEQRREFSRKANLARWAKKA